MWVGFTEFCCAYSLFKADVGDSDSIVSNGMMICVWVYEKNVKGSGDGPVYHPGFWQQLWGTPWTTSVMNTETGTWTTGQSPLLSPYKFSNCTSNYTMSASFQILSNPLKILVWATDSIIRKTSKHATHQQLPAPQVSLRHDLCLT
jgi:hypothetical protein